jgi:hypothetical protein
MIENTTVGQACEAMCARSASCANLGSPCANGVHICTSGHKRAHLVTSAHNVSYCKYS